jgi:transposase
MFERLAIDVLRETDVAGGAKILRLTWDEAHHLMERAVSRGLSRKPRAIPSHLGIDEKAISKGHKYMTIACDLNRGTVEYVADGRTEASLFSYFAPFSIADVAGVEAVAMDMWTPFFNTIVRCVPNAREKVVFDRYHIVSHMNKAVDLVRRAESKTLRAEGNETLTGSRYLWLYGEENVPDARRATFDELKIQKLKTGRAWAIKEMLRGLWDCESKLDAITYYGRWHNWATHSRLAPVINVARMVNTHLPNILTYYLHRVTNAVSEGINSAIQTIKKRAFGYRNPENFKTAIYFHCGGLDLYPTIGSHSLPG